MKRKILIAGLGLIGGSIAKSIRKSNNHVLLGFDHNDETLSYAREHHMIDEAHHDFIDAAKRADIIILATPISETIKLIKQLNEVTFDQEVIVTDVASVKGSILKAANTLTNKKITFIGGHPMAGSHKTGVKAAKEHLFENAIYVLTPTNKCAKEKVEILQEALQGTKSNFLILNPDEHDEMTSVISHFPHLIASSLVHQARKWEEKHSYLPELAAGGFRDITRIASSNPTMWQDIFYHNGSKMTMLLDEWIKEMTQLKHVVEKNDKQLMTKYLKQAKDYRDGLIPKKRGALPSFYDLYVDIKDQPGALAKVVQLLADAEISITNISILEIRDDINGALRLTFSKKETQQKGCQLLREHGYDITVEN